jgi:hypothetical protein
MHAEVLECPLDVERMDVEVTPALLWHLQGQHFRFRGRRVPAGRRNVNSENASRCKDAQTMRERT